MNEEPPKICCQIFQKQEPIIKELTHKINNTKVIHEKVKLAEEILKEVKVLLSCPDYSSEKSDCLECHFLARLRKKVADLVIKAKELTE